jgi:hypothetical protein
MVARLISREEVIERAESWLRRPVAYSQTRFHGTEFGIYRADCSGFVSMAWGLPGRPPDRYGGHDTAGLAEVSDEIGKSDLLPGDVLLRSEGTNLTRHVAIFVDWVDDSRCHYWGFEQAGGSTTAHRVIAYPYDSTPEMYVPRRFRFIREESP